MSAFIVPFSSIFVKKGFNHRAVDLEKVERLSANIEQYGLLSIYTCVQTYVEGSEVPESKAYQVVDGEFRHRAMLLLQKRNPERFEELVPNDTITINLVERNTAQKSANANATRGSSLTGGITASSKLPLGGLAGLNVL